MITKGFIFDLDGVLVDTAKYHFTAWRRLANELGIDFDEEQNEKLKGVSRKESLEKILFWGNKNLPPEEFHRFMDLKNKWYLESIENLKPDEALPGAIEFLQKCRDENIPFALGSASKNAQLILGKLRITSWFVDIVDGTKITKSKPDPQVFLLGAESMELHPEEIAVFEDSVAGIEAAHTGNFRTIGIGDPLVLSKAEITFPSLQDLEPQELLMNLS